MGRLKIIIIIIPVKEEQRQSTRKETRRKEELGERMERDCAEKGIILFSALGPESDVRFQHARARKKKQTQT